MTDTGRQSAYDKAQAALKPDSQKSSTEQMKDRAKELYESAAAKMQPESEKSNFQKTVDASSGNTSERMEPFSDQKKNALGGSGEGQQ
ncbi:hypothetical protein SCLCIDRAFT_725397 [Scleroderma citrinum Foug A]|uniref:Uncharacterized protein n=1 Tax=Scleroderma citrinum Foug A TaxID=1036808 RepID=A0A0C3A7T4_9AGAM|nr:hypothetical protein SCLCIDRAFT_725397 [Scleroderma citrinum Foug A]